MFIKNLWVNYRLLRFARNDGTISRQLFGISSLSFIPGPQNTVIASEAKQPVAFLKLINSVPSLRVRTQKFGHNVKMTGCNVLNLCMIYTV